MNLPNRTLTRLAVCLALLVAGTAAPAQTPDEQLLAASLEGELELVEEALAAGADVNASEDDGMTALLWAAGIGDARIVELLIAKGADAKAEDDEGRTALHHAADGQAANADIDDPEYQEGFRRCVELLLAAGTDPSVADEYGDTALSLAADPRIRSLLESGAADG